MADHLHRNAQGTSREGPAPASPQDEIALLMGAWDRATPSTREAFLAHVGLVHIASAPDCPEQPLSIQNGTELRLGMRAELHDQPSTSAAGLPVRADDGTSMTPRNDDRATALATATDELGPDAQQDGATLPGVPLQRRDNPPLDAMSWVGSVPTPGLLCYQKRRICGYVKCAVSGTCLAVRP